MRSRKLTLLIVSLSLAAAALPILAHAGQPANPPPATTKPDAPDLDQPMLISKTRIQEMKPVTFLYISQETTLKDIATTSKTAILGLVAARDAGKFLTKGPPVMIMHGVNDDPDHKFTLDVGFPVDDATQPVGDYKVIKLPAFRCATTIYSGSMKGQDQAWESVYSDIFAAGLQANGDARMEMLKFDGEDSPNNVILIEAGLQ